MTKTLITGGAGFTGRYLAERLAAAGDEVHSLDHHKPDGEVPGVAEVHIASLKDAEALKAVVAEVGPDRVVHLAAIAFVAHGDVEEIYETNLIGSRNLLDALADAPQTPRCVMMASSANVYGNTGGKIGEDMRLAPANDYGVTKAAMELMAATFQERLPIITVRPFNYTGVGQSPNFLIPKIVDHARCRASGIELGNTDVARDFSDVRSVVAAYAALLDNPAAIGKTFNICSGTATSLREVIDMVEAITGHVLPVTVNPDFVRENEVKSLCGDRTRLDAILGAQGSYSLEETLRWMLDS